MDMFDTIKDQLVLIQAYDTISEERKAELQPFIDYIHSKHENGQAINLNFICTHNSRRSHLAQIWAQCAAYFYNIPEVYCYSGGTETTALFPKVVEVLQGQGFEISKIADGNNPIYAIKMDEKSPPLIGFSKKYDHPFNPASDFAAIMTCDHADETCPFIAGANVRIPLRYEDPKASDGTPQQTQVYWDRSVEIAREMFYSFSRL